MNWVRYSLLVLRRMSWPITAAIAVLMVIGVVFVYGACYVSEDLPVKPLYLKQILWAVAGFGCYFSVASVDYQKITRQSWWFYAGCLLLLVLVLIVGTERYGATRWLILPGGVSVQPSEIAKLATILVMASMLNRSGEEFGRLAPVAGLLGVVAVPFLLILVEPDLGTAMVLAPTLFVMMFAAGVPLRTLGVLVAIGLTVVGLVFGALILPGKMGMDEARQEEIATKVGIRPHQRDRLMVFMDSSRDPLGTGWNKMQSEIAVGSGGMWGKGYLNGTQNILGYLPRSVAPTDFIFSVIAEETGFFGSVVVLSLFGLIVFFGLQAALGARDKMGRLLCVGAVALIFSHVFINIAMTVGLLPITGLPLPMVSYGGTFMLVVLTALGMVQSVYVRSRHA